MASRTKGRGKPGSESRRGRTARAALDTVKVPDAIAPLFEKAQAYVASYFKDWVRRPELGTITISGERYVLLRAASLSVAFFDLVTSLYQDRGPNEARRVANNILFDVAHAIGKADAEAFHRRMGVVDPIEKLSAGPIHFSFSGWAFVDILAESNPSPDEDYFLLYDHPFSFESATWLKEGRRSDFPVCIMNAGYSSGWCEQSFGLPLVAAEIECIASGGARCRFVMAPPQRIKEYLPRYMHAPEALPAPSIPEFFERKRLEDELTRANETLELRVAERTRELLEANERLVKEVAERKRAEEARDEFLSVAAHELKTPVTNLRGFSQLITRQADLGRPLDPDLLRQSLGAIDRQSERLALLVSQLLDVSRLQAGRLMLDRQPTDVAQLVAQAIDQARVSAGSRTFEVAIPALVASIDSLRVEQVLSNLLGNAIKYSPDGSPITIECSCDRGWLELAVLDRGIGIAAEHLPQIFERFYQAHPTHQLGGLGLGLYISRQIVELHGGRIWGEARGGGGTRIVVRLPIEPPEKEPS